MSMQWQATTRAVVVSGGGAAEQPLNVTLYYCTVEDAFAGVDGGSIAPFGFIY